MMIVGMLVIVYILLCVYSIFRYASSDSTQTLILRNVTPQDHVHQLAPVKSRYVLLKFQGKDFGLLARAFCLYFGHGYGRAM